MDKIEKIRQKIEQLRKLIDDHNYYLDNSEQALGYSAALDDIEKFLDTLSEEPCKSLEEAAEEHSKRVSDGHNYRDLTCGFIAGAEWQKQKMFKDCVIVECSVRVYPTLDDKPRPWVALYKNGIESNSLRDIPELENIGFKDDDTAIVIIKRKEDGQ